MNLTYRKQTFIPVLSIVVCGYQASIMNVYSSLLTQCTRL